MSPLVWYRRKGRTRRARGYVVDSDPRTRCTKVEPLTPGWKPVWITPTEIAAGQKVEQANLKLR